MLPELETLPHLLVDVKEAFEPTAAAIAAEIQHDDYHIVTGAGPVWTEAWYYGTCILEEMQWIRTRPIHASDFFHGTLELVEPGVSVLLFKGEDASRPLAERVERWCRRSPIGSPSSTPPASRCPVCPRTCGRSSPHVLIATVLERVSAHLEVLRDHPLTTRRYYRRIEY